MADSRFPQKTQLLTVFLLVTPVLVVLLVALVLIVLLVLLITLVLVAVVLTIVLHEGTSFQLVEYRGYFCPSRQKIFNKNVKK